MDEDTARREKIRWVAENPGQSTRAIIAGIGLKNSRVDSDLTALEIEGPIKWLVGPRKAHL